MFISDLLILSYESKLPDILRRKINIIEFKLWFTGKYLVWLNKLQLYKSKKYYNILKTDNEQIKL